VGSLLSWLAVVGALAALLVAVRRLVRGRFDTLGRPHGFPKITVGLLLVLSACAALPGLARWHQEAKLSSVASDIAGRGVRVKCQTLGGSMVDAGAEAGYVKWGPGGVPEHVAHLKWEQCKLLRAYVGSNKHQPSEAQYAAVHVLTHEAVHTSGVRSEPVTECKAVQRDATTAGRLGASAADARALAWLYWKVVYPRMPAEYRDDGCGPGGALDEHLPTSPWVAGH
jgi:hypothetical protein